MPDLLEIPHPLVEDDRQTLNLAKLKAWSERTGESFADLYDRVDDLEAAPPAHAPSHKPVTGTDPLDTGPGVRLNGVNEQGTADDYAQSDHNHEFPFWGLTFCSTFISAPTSAAVLANFTYAVGIKVLSRVSLIGIGFYPLSATGTCRVSLYNAAGARVANRTTNSAALGTVPMEVTFDASYTAAPGIYYAGLTFSGTPNVTMAIHDRGRLTAGPGANATAVSIVAPVAALPTPAMYVYA